MNLHLSSLFKDAVSAASDFFKIREAFIEKDYWVTFILNNLSKSSYVDQVVFKGGTSLSKVHKCIERFSEDIDLAIIENVKLGDSKRKALIQGIEKVITQGLIPYPDHPLTEKKGRNRKTFFKFNNDINNISGIIQLEINTFTEPAPFSKESVDSFVAQFFKITDRSELISQYELNTFELNVLSIERTFFEKVLSIIRLSYNGSDALKLKIRHFYDIVRIFQENRLILNSEDSIKIFRAALNDDKNNSTFAGVWLEKSLSEAHLFNDFKTLWKSLEPTYKNDLKDLIWNNTLPKSSEVIEVILKIEEFIKRIEEK